MKCKNCQAELPEGITLCPECGTENASGEKMSTSKKLTIVIVALVVLIAVLIGVIVMGMGGMGSGNTDAPETTGAAAATVPADGNPENEYLPSQYTKNCVAYTGTHDNDTLRSFIETIPLSTRKAFERALEEECLQADVPYVTETIEDECKSIVELLISSKANTVVIPMHDILCFSSEAGLNAPSTLSGENWTFRFTEKDFGRRKAAWLKELNEKYKR